MATLTRRLTVAGVLLLAVFLLCYAAVFFLVRSGGVRDRIQSEISQRTGYDVRIDGLQLTPWLSLVASGVSVSKGGRILFEGKRIVGFLLPTDFFFNRVHRLTLENPRLSLSLQNLLSPAGEMTLQLSIGSLNIHDGEFVLDTGGEKPFTLRSVSLNAKNVAVGGITGLHLRAYLPWLNGTAALSIAGTLHEKHAEILLEQTQEEPTARRLPKLPKEKAVLEARFQVNAVGRDIYQVKGSGSAHQLQWEDEKITGEFASRFEMDAKAGDLQFSLDLNTPQFPSRLLPGEISLAPTVRATLRGRYSSARKTLTVEEMKLDSSLGTLQAGGAIAFGAKRPTLNATLRLRDIALDPLKALMPKPFSAYTYAGKIAADLKLSGAYDDPIIRGLAWNDQTKIQGERISLSELSLKIPFQWAHSTFQIEAARIHGKDLVWGKEGETQLKVAGATLAGDVVKEQRKPLQMTADFQLLEGRFSNSEGSRVGEHLDVKGRVVYQEREGGASFKGEARIERLELLWDKFFGDFKVQRPSIELDGSYRREAGEVNFDRLRIALASMGRLDLKGWVRSFLVEPVFSLEIRSDNLSPGGIYDFFVRDTFKIAYPVLGRIGVTGKGGGEIRADGSVKAFTTEGTLRLRQSEIRERSGGWRMGQLALDLPFKLAYPEALREKASEAAPAGRLSIRQIQTASTTIPEISVPVVFWNNMLRFPEPIRASLFGGEGRIEKLAWRDVIGAPRELSFSVSLDNLSLLGLTEALGWHRFAGTLSGSIPEVRWEGDSLRSDGEITLDVFGGRVAIRGMEVEKPLSPLQAIRMDVRFEGLDLERASETFEFGRISGVLSGTIGDLVITQGQPAQFDSNIRTVEKAGVSQWISVEALDKITVLSSGNEAGSIYGGLAGFFDFFRYSKLGFRASLKNDKLVLRGVESEDGKEYLVVGSWLPPTVNIVSHTQEIGFSELLRRLERIQKNDKSKP